MGTKVLINRCTRYLWMLLRANASLWTTHARSEMSADCIEMNPADAVCRQLLGLAQPIRSALNQQRRFMMVGINPGTSSEHVCCDPQPGQLVPPEPA